MSFSSLTVLLLVLGTSCYCLCATADKLQPKQQQQQQQQQEQEQQQSHESKSTMHKRFMSYDVEDTNYWLRKLRAHAQLSRLQDELRDEIQQLNNDGEYDDVAKKQQQEQEQPSPEEKLRHQLEEELRKRQERAQYRKMLSKRLLNTRLFSNKRGLKNVGYGFGK